MMMMMMMPMMIILVGKEKNSKKVCSSGHYVKIFYNSDFFRNVKKKWIFLDTGPVLEISSVLITEHGLH